MSMVAEEFMRFDFFFVFFRAIGGVWEFEDFAGEVFLGDVR